MQTYDHFRKARQRTVDALQRVENQLERLGGSAKSKSLSNSRIRLLANDFRVIFCGEFKRGKSTLINAMLGDKVVPMKIAPCTGVITEVKYDVMPRILIHPKQGDPYDAPMENLSTAVSIDGDDNELIEKVEVFTQSGLCEKAVTLIDSPGLNEDWRRTQAALREIKDADAACMVLSCEMALSRSEMDFLQSQLSERKSGIFFLWNRYDAVWDNNEEIAAIRELSTSRLNAIGGEIYYVSAREALVGKRKQDDRRFEKSGVATFMDALESFLVETRAAVKLEAPLQQGIQACLYGLRVLAPRAEKLIVAKRSELNTSASTIMPRLAELDRQRDAATKAIQESVEDLSDDILSKLEEFATALALNAFGASTQIDFTAYKNRQERQDHLLRWYRKWYRDALKSLAHQDLLPILENGVKELETDLIDKRLGFHKDIQDLLNIDENIDLSASPLFDSEWLEELPENISSSIALLIFGLSSATLTVSLLSMGALQAWLTGDTLNEDDRRKLAESLAMGIRSKMPEFRVQIKSQLQQACDLISLRLNEEMSQLVSDARQQLDAAIAKNRGSQQHDLPNQQEIDTASAELEACLDILNEVMNHD